MIESKIKSIALIPQLTLTGEVGKLVRLEYAEEAGKPWRTLTSMVLTNSPFLFLDTTAGTSSGRIYRIASSNVAPAMVKINPGSFFMGSPEQEAERSPEEGPRRHVTLTKPFSIGKTPVTQAEYMAVTGVNPSQFPADLACPVDSVSWEDARAYCAKLTIQERGAGRIAGAQVYRLPTEAEWEYACRAGTTTRFSHGDDPGFSGLMTHAWFGGNSDEKPHPVATKLPNPWGLFDMHGNVWEWCADWYHNNYSGIGPTDPVDSSISNEGCSIRGGSWKGMGRFCRSASRGGSTIPGHNLGFRVVLTGV
jgi:eukaryotic-like serine/threonine-protein kinase